MHGLLNIFIFEFLIAKFIAHEISATTKLMNVKACTIVIYTLSYHCDLIKLILQ